MAIREGLAVRAVILLAIVMIASLAANVYAASTSVGPGEYLYITGDPAEVNGRVPPTYNDVAVIVSDQGCVFTGLEEPYRGDTINYKDNIAARYDLHNNPGIVHLTPGKYFSGLQINILVPSGYAGNLASNIRGNGTHLLATFYINGNAVPAVYRLPVSIVVAWRSGPLGTGWFIGPYGPAQGLVLDLTGVKVASVRGTCTSISTNPSTTASRTATTTAQQEVLQGIPVSGHGKTVVGLGLAVLIIAVSAVFLLKNG